MGCFEEKNIQHSLHARSNGIKPFVHKGNNRIINMFAVFFKLQMREF